VTVLGALAVSECQLQVSHVASEAGRLRVVVTHAPECEVSIDQKEGNIVFSANIHTSQKVQEAQKGSHEQESKVEQILALAKRKLGSRYEPAKAGPDHFDCSGFVYYLFKQNGITIPRSSRLQSESGKKLTRDMLQPGDILFFDTHHRGHVNHSGIYLGKGKFIHSSSGKAYGVTVSDLDQGFYKEKFLWGVHKVP
jgi:cell wall-associated NlpC family hydrolase